MVPITIDRLMIEVQTADGPFGLDITFSKGLCVLRVENSHGKSTCVNAIAYALGMEMALGQQTAKPPFPPSLLKTIQDEQGSEKLVISSSVKLQITNHQGRTVSLRRNVLGSDAESIIELREGGITEKNAEAIKLFLHREGDSTRDLGFYYWLSNFIGWELPLVPNNIGGNYPLYPPVIFPLFFVEQKKGWSSIQATTPLIFNIPQVKKRAFEFVMNLDVNDIVKRKAANKSYIDEVQNKWSISYSELKNVAIRIGGRVTGIKESPSAKFDSFKLDILVETGGAWKSLSDVLEEKRLELFSLLSDSSRVATGSVASEKQIEDLKRLKEYLRELEERYDNLQEEVGFIYDQIRSTETRVESLIDDKRKYEDLKKIKSYDSLGGFPIINNECPTCGQYYSDHGSHFDCSDELMTLEESLEFIKSQLNAFRSVLNSYRSQLDVKNLELSNVNRDINLASDSLSRLKQALYSDSPLVDESLLREKINLENYISDLQEAIVAMAEFRSYFDSLYARYKELVRIRKGFPIHGFSHQDKKKLIALEQQVINYLEEFGFSSFSPELLKISDDNYLPTREGFDLGFDTSASDGIRIIWSYLLGIFNLRGDFNTNHPGILIFDEPRQQEANQVSFISLLKGASTAASKGQIIFATSEEEQLLRNGLGNCEYKLLSFSSKDGKILRKLK